MRILIVEDDRRIASPVAHRLKQERHVVEICDDGTSGYEYASSGVYDVVLLDTMLPGIDGVTVCRRLRDMRVSSAILMMTARDAIEDKVAALDAGADDYVTKPFELAELSARIRALGRREPAMRRDEMRHGSLALNVQTRQVTCNDNQIDLTPTEFSILETLMRRPKQVFSGEMLLEKVRPFESRAGAGAMRMHVANLRRKLRAAGCGVDPISTSYRNGYRLGDLD